MQLNHKARVVLGHVVSLGLVLAAAALGADWVFSRKVLGEVDLALLQLAHKEVTAVPADPRQQPIRVHDMPPGTARPSLPRLDKFVQIVDLDGHIVARGANLGTARLPTPPSLLKQLRAGERVFEIVDDFGDEPLRLLSVPVQVGGVGYAIQVAGSFRDATVARRSALLLFVAMAAAIFAAVTLSSVRLARSVLNPIAQIVQRAHSVGAATLGERLPHPGSRGEMARLVETLNEMLDRIEKGVAAQRRVAADVCQELLSPMSRLRAELEVTLRGPRERGEYEEALLSCLREVDQLSRLTNELLALARIEAGGPREGAPAVPLEPILPDAVTRLAPPEALHRDVALVLDAPREQSSGSPPQQPGRSWPARRTTP